MSKCKLSCTALAGGAALMVVRGAGSGPTLALLGGVHGDEDEGVLAIRCLLQEIAKRPLAGTVRAVAPANPIAWAAQSRTGPLDGVNMARAFPGDPDGSPTAVLAAAITHETIAGADLLIDLHSAGVRYRMPLFCGFIAEGAAANGSRRAAIAFGTPIIWTHVGGVPPGRSLSVAMERGIPAIYAECAGGGSIRSGELDAYVRGVLSVMADFGMIPDSCDRQKHAKARWVYGGDDLDLGAQASHAGLFVSSAGAGAILAEGAEIGRIYDYRGRQLDVVRAPHQGMVMFLRRKARIQVGDVLFALAHLEEKQP